MLKICVCVWGRWEGKHLIGLREARVLGPTIKPHCHSYQEKFYCHDRELYKERKRGREKEQEKARES